MITAELPPMPSRKRPRGLWKGQTQSQQAILGTHNNSFSDADSASGDDGGRASTLPPSASKRRKYYFSSKAASERNDFGAHHSANHKFPILLRRDMTSTMNVASPLVDNRNATHISGYSDWENLKDLFAKAVERYEDDDTKEALVLLRRVVHECCTFFETFHDPSVLFTGGSNPRQQSNSPETLTASKERLFRDLDANVQPYNKESPPLTIPDSPTRHSTRSPELPTAFHSLFGTALFLFGNLIAQDSSGLQPREPDMPCPYWLAALDVFETGENIPRLTDGRGYTTVQDWRMPIIWGRTLVCLADMAVTRASNPKTTGSVTNTAIGEMTIPPGSPLAVIASRRPPSTQRISLSNNSPHDLMVLAMDQFSRGIFHMPHPQNQVNTSPSSASEQFSRPKELFTIASEVLGIAERLEEGAHRQYWATWADSVFSQMKMEADMDVWRGPITRARGRCWLIIGSAGAEPIEAKLEAGDSQVLHSDSASEARHALTMAISFFERAKGSAMSWLDPESEELKPLMTEALLTLANLSVDENKREELYSRAQAESENSLNLDDEEKMDQSD